MVIENKKLKPGEYELIKEGKEEVMKINFIGLSYSPSIEDDSLSMSSVMDRLIEVPGVTRIILSSDRNYHYSVNQVSMLREIANIYTYLTKQKNILSLSVLGITTDYTQKIPSRFSDIQYIINNLLKGDPLGAYVETKRIIREQKIRLKKTKHPSLVKSENSYLNVLLDIFNILDKTKLISHFKNQLDGYIVGDRGFYSKVFRPTIFPNFMLTRLMARIPVGADEIDSYSLDKNTQVIIFKVPGDVKLTYHLTPPEFNLSEDHLELLDLAKEVLSEHKPTTEEFMDPERVRQTFFNIGRDLIKEIADSRKIKLSYEESGELANILVRYTIGFGLIEILLGDPKVQDVSVNGPIGETPIFIVHQDHGDCVTNITPSTEDGESWATKFRIMSGRPLDEANPILDTELVVSAFRARVSIITSPLNPVGIAYSFRRHRDKPWTLPLFIDNKMINPLGAALLGFLIDGSRTLLVAGTRSSGKTSLLGSCLVEIMRRYRIITVEDTLELPVSSLRDLGYNIQPMKVRSALASGGTELAAEEGIRTSLRLGDSSLILGEIRSKEALALYEAMRIGALANVVAGTIHGGSPYAVFDRVVNDLGVPKTSFKATDIIVVANPIKSPDGLHTKRRVVSITEVRKEWTDDPLIEGGFVDLMKYNHETDQLEPTDNLINGDSEVIKSIAANVKEWAGNWDAIWENILLRSKIKEKLVETANQLKRKDILEAKFTVKANDEFHRISDEILTKLGNLDSKKILFRWDDWLKKEVKRGYDDNSERGS
jgi:archaeal flagellar protein FlaI